MENTFNYTNHKMRNAVLRFLHLYDISYIYLFMLTSQFSPLEGTYKNGVLWGCKNIFNCKLGIFILLLLTIHNGFLVYQLKNKRKERFKLMFKPFLLYQFGIIVQQEKGLRLHSNLNL